MDRNEGASNSMGDWRAINAGVNRNGGQQQQTHQQQSQQEERQPEYVYTLGKHDVLLGRGTGPNNNNGNVEFRTAVEGCKIAYISTTSRKAKNSIVRDAVQSIKVQGGRFLNKLTKSEVKMRGLPHKVVYEIADDGVAVEKVKQALRYVCYKKEATRIEIQPSRKRKKRPRSSSEDNQLQQHHHRPDDDGKPSSQAGSYKRNESTTSEASTNLFLPSSSAAMDDHTQAQRNEELKVRMAYANGNAGTTNGNGNMQRNTETTNPAQVASLPPIGNSEAFAQLPPTPPMAATSHESLSNLSSASMMRHASEPAPANPVLSNGQQQQQSNLSADRIAIESFLATAASGQAMMAQTWQQQQPAYAIPTHDSSNPTAGDGLNDATASNFNNNHTFGGNNSQTNSSNGGNNYAAASNPLVLQNPVFGQMLSQPPPPIAMVNNTAVTPPQIDHQMLAGLFQCGGNHGQLLALLILQQQHQQQQN